MATIKKQLVVNPLFGKENFIWMLAGAGVMAMGFFLMAGGKSADPTKFMDGEIYSTTRITIAPINFVGSALLPPAIKKKPMAIIPAPASIHIKFSFPKSGFTTSCFLLVAM